MDIDPRLLKAFDRYQVVSSYLALNPSRGQRCETRKKLAAQTWHTHDGQPFTVAAETLRVWIRRYRYGGLKALMDKPRAKRGVRVLSDDDVTLLCNMKREVPQRSLDRILLILEQTGATAPGLVTRSTLHRVLFAHDLSARPPQPTSDTDLDRFEASAPNDLWQSDMLVGPWLPDPDRPGKTRRCYLYAFLDDHSRMLLAGRFFFKGDLPALELVFREALRKHGRPSRVYYDNGKVYRAHHMKQIVATIGTQGITHTQVYRPMGHGKIEAFNRHCRSAFLSDLAVSGLKTLDAINEAFIAWGAQYYNVRVHGETGEAPIERWKAAKHVHHIEEETLRVAFLFKDSRKTDKAGIFSLFGTRYQVGASLLNRRIVVRYDPEQLDEVEVWTTDDRFVQRVRPFEVQQHRRPRASTPEPASDSKPATSGIDWLGHLTKQHQDDKVTAPQRPRRADLDDAIVSLLREKVDDAVFDEVVVRDFLQRFGPFETAPATVILERWMRQQPSDLHITAYLQAIRDMLGGA